MSSLVIFLVVIIAIIEPRNVMGSISAQEIDVDKLLELVKEQQRSNRADSSDSSDSDDSDDSDTSSEDLARTGRVGGDTLIDVISKVVINRNKEANNNRKERASNEAVQVYNARNSKYDNSQRSNDVVELLEQLFNKADKDSPPKQRQTKSRNAKKRLIPNRLLGDVRNKISDEGLENYSKIYILLNPQAIQRSKDNKSSVNKLISKILSLSSPPSKRVEVKPKQRRYKGFAIKGDIGRRRGSREIYAPKDSIEDKPKRNHNSGGGAGHTAIPYIRHRGENIYERDN